MLEAVIPYLGAIEFFLGFWIAIPVPIQRFLSFLLSCILGVAVIKVVLED